MVFSSHLFLFYRGSAARSGSQLENRNLTPGFRVSVAAE